jgi:hypothetical protein
LKILAELKNLDIFDALAYRDEAGKSCLDTLQDKIMYRLPIVTMMTEGINSI